MLVGLACGRSEPSTAPVDGQAGAAAAIPAVETQLRGSLVGHDGEAMAMAHVHALQPGQPAIDVEVDAQGRFELDLSGRSYVTLHFTGVNHAESRIGVLADGGSHELEVRLGTYPRPDGYESLAGFGTFETSEGEGEGEAEAESAAPPPRVDFEFTRREDGIWVAKIERDDASAGATQLHYQLRNLTSSNRTMNGSRSDRFVYDGGGDYFSVIDVGDGPVELEFDPSTLPPADRALHASFARPDSAFARFAELARTIEDWSGAARDDYRAQVEDRPDEGTQVYLETQRALLAKLEAERGKREGQERTLVSLAMADVIQGLERFEDSEGDDADAGESEHEALFEELLATLAPSDPLWSARPGAMAMAIEQCDAPDYFAKAAAEHADDNVVGALWFGALVAANEAGDLVRAREAVAKLKGERFADGFYALMVRSQDPDRPMAPGKQVPDFRLTSIDGSREFTPSDMRGQVYLIDFWATWCGPCVAELPNVHAAWAEFNGHELEADAKPAAFRKLKTTKFEIIAVSFDHDVDIVEKFHAEQWPMPWANVVADEALHKKLNEDFGIVGIPAMVLVGRDGTILASGGELRGPGLEARVREALAAKPTEAAKATN